ncbi:hypothetical protein TGAM01_v201309 [Trichoderma gamsii]|uniref:Glutathione S-transferase n=1 Tax=Trichoderma gamsii TaxID=398673 RepID=A0A0W7VDV4_9HYPO|nr:hypothetical protein TGAM01_v201309 [Trichoderma gamsii]PNP37767.1 hypothetical protein TGAMA5MH_10252 [Trichoderma gamsii]PON29943.1 hypothetical protein TGAM01_v201309 [Trichoderma gamsii]
MAAETTPTLHYFDLGTMGRGEVIRIFLRDAGIEFKDIRHSYGTWSTEKEKFKEQGITRTGKLPALIINGTILNQHIPILRYLARDIGRYDGETNHEKFQVDAVADNYIDWRAQWVANIGNVSDEYKTKFLPNYYAAVAKYYAENKGPYLLGDKITYADFAVYQSIDNDERIGALPSELPAEIVKLREAIEARPNIKAYIEGNRKKE